MNEEKINRFAKAFEKYNRSPKMAELFNEMVDEISGLENYASQIEMDLFENETAKYEFIHFYAKGQKLIQRAYVWLEQIRYVNEDKDTRCFGKKH